VTLEEQERLRACTLALKKLPRCCIALVDEGGSRATIEVGLNREDKPMPRLAPTPLQLNAIEREQLQQLVQRHRTPQ
jgi:hypothetical protein